MLNTFMTDFKANKTFYGLTVIEENLRLNVDMLDFTTQKVLLKKLCTIKFAKEIEYD